jgi:hypothetical protein
MSGRPATAKAETSCGQPWCSACPQDHEPTQLVALIAGRDIVSFDRHRQKEPASPPQALVPLWDVDGRAPPEVRRHGRGPPVLAGRVIRSAGGSRAAGVPSSLRSDRFAPLPPLTLSVTKARRGDFRSSRLRGVDHQTAGLTCQKPPRLHGRADGDVADAQLRCVGR